MATSAFSSPEMETGTVKGEHSIVFLASLCHAVSENKRAISNSGRFKLKKISALKNTHAIILQIYQFCAQHLNNTMEHRYTTLKNKSQ